MNKQRETEDRLEKRLRGCRPAPVPPAVMSSLRSCLPPQKVQPRSACRFSKGLMAIAATGLLCFFVPLLMVKQKRECPAAQQGTFSGKPLANRLTVKSSDNYFLGVRNVGIWSAPDGRAYKVVQGVAVNQTVIKNSETGSELKMIEPQQRVLLLAMSTQ